MDTLHPLLQAQLQSLALDSAPPRDQAAWGALLERVSACYEACDATRDAIAVGKQQLIESEARFDALMALSTDWFWEQDAQYRFVSLASGGRSAAFAQEVYLGRTRWELPGVELVSGDWDAHRAVLERKERFRNLVYRIVGGEDEERFISVSGEPIVNASGAFCGYRGVARDVTAEKMAERQAIDLAQYDPLTGLSNRTLLSRQLDLALSKARRHGRRLALVFIDLDGFKQINDTYGHSVGDRVLKETARRLREAVRSEDCLARVGGDEFLALIEDFDSQTPQQAACRLLETLSMPIVVEDREFTLSASIGISTFPTDSAESEMLLQQADLAMYRVKAGGGAGIGYFSPELHTNAYERLQTATGLRRALDSGQFRLVWQPVSDASTGQVVSVEALLRWFHPQRGEVTPDSFLKVAEETGLIVSIGRWVITQACRQARLWHDAGRRVPISVNLSARQIRDPGLLSDIAAALAEHGIAPAYLELELNEAAVMSDVARSTELLGRIKELGAGVTLDDFGTGHSSLAWMRRLPFDTVKLDRTFLLELVAHPDDLELTRAVIAMAHSLRQRVVAEGVENEAQAALFRELGCDALQGNLTGAPVPADSLDLSAWVDQPLSLRKASRSGASTSIGIGNTIVDDLSPAI
ncbi:MAG: EAL domain-containing protein [Burkholderiaceae bacterium]|nr:EAL domain-containing protein [Burkholderiaceae bacterium]